MALPSIQQVQQQQAQEMQQQFNGTELVMLYQYQVRSSQVGGGDRTRASVGQSGGPYLVLS